MSAVTVEPEQFRLVEFDAGRIAEFVAEVAGRVGAGAYRIEVVVDETTPQGRARVVSMDPIRLEIEGGAFEDARYPRRWSPEATAEVVGRLLIRALDRLDPAFADAPADDDLTLAEAVAWDAACLGRLARAGFHPHQGRRRYHFRLRHGFNDAADTAFEALWGADPVSWANIAATSSAGRGVTTAST